MKTARRPFRSLFKNCNAYCMYGICARVYCDTFEITVVVMVAADVSARPLKPKPKLFENEKRDRDLRRRR